ncbi:MAG TPA: glycosyl hydrolase 53 family protein [Verrucomicrobiae bacterium]|nr:glycosyl hydrolase 53 family protein [Verrucomicrobiae bacterium]
MKGRLTVFFAVVAAVVCTVLASAQTYYVAGDFNSWNPAGNVMTQITAGVWQASFTNLNVGRHEFKITTGTWDTNYPPYNSWLYTDSSGNVTVTFKSNTVSDGWYGAFGRIGVNVDPGSWTAVGNWQGWNTTNPATAMTPLGGGVYKLSTNLPPGAYQYQAVITGSDAGTNPNWNAIGGDFRSVGAVSLNFTNATPRPVAYDFYVNALAGVITVSRSPLPYTFVTGADMSYLAYLESQGVVYKEGGVATDALAILRQSGVMCVRLRLFTSSAAQAAADPYDYVNNLTYTIPLAQRVKNAGLQFCLDFHYSDTWADPGHQAIPSAWTNLSFAALVQQMFNYNSNTIAAFRAAGAMPDYAQVGNEINSGMLWPYGEVGSPSNNWSQLAQLMNAAIEGIQAASAGTSMPKIIVHLGSGGDWGSTEWFFDNLNAQGVPFDIIGLSYYWNWAGTLADLSNCLNNAANRYQKPVSVMETAFPWNNSYLQTNNVNGIVPSVTGQVQYVVALAPIVMGVSGGYGAGVFWWGTEYQSYETSWFDTGGNVLPAAAEFGQMSAPLNLNIRLNSTNVTLSWLLSGAGLSLVMTTNLSPPVTWSPVTNAVQNTGTVYWVTMPLDSSPQQFYRLQSNW